jgi:hypothetical protein
MADCSASAEMSASSPPLSAGPASGLTDEAQLFEARLGVGQEFGEPDAGRFDEEAKLAGVGQRSLGVRNRGRAGERGGFLLGDARFVQGAIRQADAALEAFAERPGGFDGNRKIEVSRKGHLLANR